MLEREIHERELELAWEDPARAVEVWRTQIGRLGRALGSGLNRVVEAFAERRAHCRVVADFVYQLEARLVVVADGSHLR